MALPNGGRMPLLGFGTWQLTGHAAREAVGWALESGYRHVDTATMYRNEREVGAAIRESGVAREQVFVTTKLPPSRADAPRETLEQSLEALDMDYVDLWLIHWPPDRHRALDVWQAFVRARTDGLARDIGVSNYSPAQIDEAGRATDVVPAVNQIEWSPLLYDEQLVRAHRERGVVLEGYSALLGGTMEHPAIVQIAQRHERTPAQVIIRWHLQHEIVVIPKSSKRERIASNADVAAFELPPDDMATLDGLSRGRA